MGALFRALLDHCLIYPESIVVKPLLQERVKTELLQLLGDLSLGKKVDFAFLALSLDKDLFVGRLLHALGLLFGVLGGLLGEAHVHLDVAAAVVEVSDMVEVVLVAIQIFAPFNRFLTKSSQIASSKHDSEIGFASRVLKTISKTNTQRERSHQACVEKVVRDYRKTFPSEKSR